MPRRQKPPRLWERRDERVWIIIDAGKHIRTGCSTDQRPEAETALREYLNDKVSRKETIVDHSKITIGELLANYADDKGPSHRDPARTAYAIQALAPFWGGLTTSDITIAKTCEYERYRAKSSSTIRRELGVLRAALNYAQLSIQLPNPPKIQFPKKPAPRKRWLTQNEIAALQQSAPPHLQRFIMISVLTGRRKRAVLDLGWNPSPNQGWIDLNLGMIHFLGTDEVETKKQRGSITMPKPLWDAAKQWHLDGNSSVIHYERKKVADIVTSFKRACKAANLEDVVPHVLKHTAVTWAFQNGMTLEDAVDYFATSAATLMGVYRQHSPHHQDRAVGIMNQIGIDFIANNVAENSSEIAKTS